MLLPLQDSVIVLYFVTLCPFLFYNHLDGEERELAALLVSRDCCVAIPLSAKGLSAVFDCDTHYFWVPFMRTVMALATFARSSLSLRHSLKFSCVTQMAIECHFVRAAKDLASLHICTGLP